MMLLVLIIWGAKELFFVYSAGNQITLSSIAQGLAEAQQAKIAVTEFYQTEGRLPGSNAELRLPPKPRSPVLERIDIEAQGVVVLTYNSKAKNGQVRLIPNYSEQPRYGRNPNLKGSLVPIPRKQHRAHELAWTCVSSNFTHIGQINPNCRFQAAGERQ